MTLMGIVVLNLTNNGQYTIGVTFYKIVMILH